MTYLFRGPGWIVISVCSSIKRPNSFIFASFFFLLLLLSSAAFCDSMADIVPKFRTIEVRYTHFFSLRGIKAGGQSRAGNSVGRNGPILPARIANQSTLHITHGHCQRYDKLELCIWEFKFCGFKQL